MHSITFKGGIDDLKALVLLLHTEGHWIHEGAFDRFCTKNGESINFWPKTGEITINGHPRAAHDLSESLRKLVISLGRESEQDQPTS
jgi:hypothetical protein